jgi:hypothetical protein
VSTATDLFGSDPAISDRYGALPDVEKEKPFPSGTSIFPQFRKEADEPVLPQPRSFFLRLVRRVNSFLLD